MNEAEKKYYQRQLKLKGFGETAQSKLKNAKVLVVGAGGLACPALQYLAGAGVGTIGILDGDEVEFHNLHRQTLYTVEAVGQKKVMAAAQRLHFMNPHITIKTHPVFLTIENAVEMVSNYDFILDCTDNFPVRYLINDVCVLLDKPFVYGSIFRFEGQISIFNWNNGPTYRCVFPESETNKNVLNCNEDGVLGFLPGIIGLYQGMETIKLITGIGENLSGKIMIINLLNNQVQKIVIQRKNINYKEILHQNGLQNNAFSCSVDDVRQIRWNQIEELEDYLFLDVRNRDELPRLQLEKVLEIPLDEIPQKLSEIPNDKEIICVCKSGMRSLRAIEILAQESHYQLYNLEKGLTKEFLEKWKRK